jgi:hypothetical protein
VKSIRSNRSGRLQFIGVVEAAVATFATPKPLETTALAYQYPQANQHEN